MKVILTILSGLCLMLSFAPVSQAKGWRGIVPLHSTRADVLKLLGEPPPPPTDGSRFYTLNQGRSIYFTDEGEVYIVFAWGLGDYHECARQLPEDTVMLVEVSPKTKFKLADLQLDEKRLRTFDPSSPPNLGYEGYVDDEEGLVIRTFEGEVEEVSYIAVAKDRHLCPSYYEKPERLVSLTVDFLPESEKLDEYGALSWDAEKARLRNFAALLGQRPDAQGYVMTYAGRQAHAGEAQSRAERARAYLEKELKLEEGRIVAVDGGFREKQAVELFAVPVGSPPPTPLPTLDPAEVRLLEGKAKTRKRRKRVASKATPHKHNKHMHPTRSQPTSHPQRH